jgi:hypothetical protein
MNDRIRLQPLEPDDPADLAARFSARRDYFPLKCTLIISAAMSV